MLLARSRAWALLVLCVIVAPLAAQERPTRGVALNWVRLPGAESCIPPVELASRVERRLGRPVFVRTGDAIIVIEGRVGAVPSGGFEMVLAVSDPDGHSYGSRELHVPGADCSKLAELAALIVSITIRHEGASAGIELPAEVASQLAQMFADDPSELDPAELPAIAAPSVQNAHTARQATTNAMNATNASPPEPRVWFLRAEAGAQLSTGLQPSATLGPYLLLAAARAGWGSAGLTGTFGAAQAQRASAEEPGQLRYQPWQIGFSVCWQAAGSLSRVLELALCAGGAVGRIHVEASNFLQVNRAISKLFAEVAASASLRARVWGPSYLQVRLGVPFRVIQPAFQYQSSLGESRRTFSVAPVGLLLEFGAGVEL
jgi:hypothetical protein